MSLEDSRKEYMKLFERLENLIFEDVASSPQLDSAIPDVSTGSITYDQYVFQSMNNSVWSYDLAIEIVKTYLANALMNVDWDVYVGNKKNCTEAYYKLNYACNFKESTSEFYSKLADRLIEKGEALIIVVGMKDDISMSEFFVADDYKFKNDRQLDLKPNTFVNVVVGDTVLYKHFRENENCIYIKMSHLLKNENMFRIMNKEFSNIKSMIEKGAKKAMGTKLNLDINAQGKNVMNETYIKSIQSRYKPLMESDNGVYITYNGETLSDLTEKQRGSEVEQVLNLAKNNITINENIIKSVGAVFGIPENYMLGRITTDMADSSEYFMTHFIKPRLKLIANKFTLFFYDQKEILSGYRVKPVLETVQFMSVLSKASAIDKLIGCGAYSINEIRAKLDDDPCEDGDIRVITKNYSDIDTFKKGGEQDGK